jgi:hypothetical protein
MKQAIVNLSLPVITGKVEEVLHSYPLSPHQQTFSSQALREKLIAYVLRRMPTMYTTTEVTKACSIDMPANCFSQEQHQQMERLIHEGIQHLMARQQSWEATAQGASLGAGASPSSWFG